MKLFFKKKSYNFEKQIKLIDALFSINPKINKDIFCREGRCKSCYCSIMYKGNFDMFEVLACKTSLKKDIRIISTSKALNP